MRETHTYPEFWIFQTRKIVFKLKMKKERKEVLLDISPKPCQDKSNT